MRRKEDAIRYGIKPKQHVVRISIKRQEEMQEVLLLVHEVLLLHKKRQGESL